MLSWLDDYKGLKKSRNGEHFFAKKLCLSSWAW